MGAVGVAGTHFETCIRHHGAVGCGRRTKQFEPFCGGKFYERVILVDVRRFEFETPRLNFRVLVGDVLADDSGFSGVALCLVRGQLAFF